MSFPNPETYVPATPPSKRGPSLTVRIPEQFRDEAQYQETIAVPNLGLDALVEEVSKQPLPDYAAYSHELAQVSSFALEHSGDEGTMDYLHWKQFHNARPAGPWDICPCENVIFELSDSDEELMTLEELNRLMYEPQETFDASPNYGPITAEIESAFLADMFGDNANPDPGVFVVGSPSDDEDNTIPAAVSVQTNEFQVPTLQMPSPNQGMNPLATSFHMTDVPGLLKSALVQPEQPEIHDCGDRDENK